MNIEERYLAITEIIKNGNDPRTDDFIKFIKYLEDNTEWINSPASTKYHGSYTGGLIEHSVSVAEVCIKLKKLFAPEVSIQSAAFCGLVHDVGKIGLYIQRDPTPKQIEYGYPGSICFMDSVLDCSHHEYRSLKMIGEYVKLTGDEYEAIQYHNSPWNGNRDCAFHENKLMTILQYADYWSTVYLENGGSIDSRNR